MWLTDRFEHICVLDLRVIDFGCVQKKSLLGVIACRICSEVKALSFVLTFSRSSGDDITAADIENSLTAKQSKSQLC